MNRQAINIFSCTIVTVLASCFLTLAPTGAGLADRDPRPELRGHVLYAG